MFFPSPRQPRKCILYWLFSFSSRFKSLISWSKLGWELWNFGISFHSITIVLINENPLRWRHWLWDALMWILSTLGISKLCVQFLSSIEMMRSLLFFIDQKSSKWKQISFIVWLFCEFFWFHQLLERDEFPCSPADAHFSFFLSPFL